MLKPRLRADNVAPRPERGDRQLPTDWGPPLSSCSRTPSPPPSAAASQTTDIRLILTWLCEWSTSVTRASGSRRADAPSSCRSRRGAVDPVSDRPPVATLTAPGAHGSPPCHGRGVPKIAAPILQPCTAPTWQIISPRSCYALPSRRHRAGRRAVPDATAIRSPAGARSHELGVAGAVCQRRSVNARR